MSNTMLSKEEFCGYINRMKTAWDTDMKISGLARNARSDFLGSDMSYLAADMCKLLQILMGCEVNDIEYFCFCLDFGESWESGMVTDGNGNDIDLSTAEKLYDFLVNNQK